MMSAKIDCRQAHKGEAISPGPLPRLPNGLAFEEGRRTLTIVVVFWSLDFMAVLRAVLSWSRIGSRFTAASTTGEEDEEDGASPANNRAKRGAGIDRRRARRGRRREEDMIKERDVCVRRGDDGCG